MKIDSKILPSIMLLSGSAIGALSGLFIKVLPFSTVTLLGFRFVIPFLIMLPYVLRKKNFFGRRKDRFILWGGGILNLLRMIFYIIAFKLTGMGNAVVLLYLWPVFALIVNSVWRRKLPGIKYILIILTAFTGVVVMNIHREFSLSNSDLYGSLAMITSAFIFSLAVFIYKKALSAYSEGEVIFFQNSSGALVLLPFLLIEAGSGIFSVSDILLGTLYGLLVGIVTFLLYFYCLKRMAVFQYSILTYSEIIFAVVFGIVFLGESIVINQIIGMVIVVVSSFTALLIKDVQ